MVYLVFVINIHHDLQKTNFESERQQIP